MAFSKTIRSLKFRSDQSKQGIRKVLDQIKIKNLPNGVTKEAKKKISRSNFLA